MAALKAQMEEKDKKIKSLEDSDAKKAKEIEQKKDDEDPDYNELILIPTPNSTYNLMEGEAENQARPCTERERPR